MNALDVRSDCGHVAAAGPRCVTEGCGHIAELHNLAGDNTTRKACSVSTGRDATPCGCPRFTPEEVS
jgi:hypothetical protein